MGKIVSKLRELRLEYQFVAKRNISVQEVANELGLSRVRLTNLELGKIDRIDTGELERICTFYSRVLKRTVDTNEVLGYEPNNKQALDTAAA